MKLRFAALLLALATPACAYAQGGLVRDYVLQTQTLANPTITYAKPIAGASIRVCTGGGTPCSPLASIYSESTLSSAQSNPFGSDTNGNFSFYAAPGYYYVDVTVNGTATQFLYAVNNTAGSAIAATTITATSATITTVTASALVSGTLSLTGQLTSTLATGTAPFVIASATGVANLRALRHPLTQFCGTTTTCSATAQTNVQVVYGSAALDNASPSVAAVTGISPAFTSTATYNCTVTNNTTTTNDVKVTKISGSAFTMTGPNTTTDVISYVCVGT